MSKDTLRNPTATRSLAALVLGRDCEPARVQIGVKVVVVIPENSVPAAETWRSKSRTHFRLVPQASYL